MADVFPSLAVRSSSGITIANGPPNDVSNSSFLSDTSKMCRTMAFSSDGKLFAWSNGVSIKVAETSSWQIVAELPRPKAAMLVFSPRGTYLMSWEVFTVSNAEPLGGPNLFVYSTTDWQPIATFVHKKQTNWELQWTSDEQLCGRLVNNDIVFYEHANFEQIVHRMHAAKVKVACFSLAPGPAPNHVLCYTPGGQGQPALGRLFKYPNFELQQSVANKSFFQADKVDFYWNNKGTSALLLTSTEVDKTGASYYGKQTLHYMATNGNSSMVTLSKEGPIHSVAWSPKSTEFCVIYGFMPSKATIFNLKCEPAFELGTAPRNTIHYNTHGNILLVAGFGNLRGQVECWDIQSRRLISKCDAPDTTVLQWCPDGVHFITATTAPRLRIANGYKVWHYSGTLQFDRPWTAQEELYDVRWQPCAAGTYAEHAIRYEPVTGIQVSQPMPSKQAYRPPCARGRPAVQFKLHDDEQDARAPDGTAEKTKAALKQKKKRDAKRARNKQGEADGDEQETDAIKSNLTVVLTGDADKDKKIKNLKKKLDAINKLKTLQGQGKLLEVNQVAKIKGEDDLLEELKMLQMI